MAHQIIPLPQHNWENEKRYAIFSTFTDRWIRFELTAQEVVDYFVQLAQHQAEVDVRWELEAIDHDPREAYAEFAISFEEANKASVDSGGPDLITCGREIGQVKYGDNLFPVHCDRQRGHSSEINCSGTSGIILE